MDSPAPRARDLLPLARDLCAGECGIALGGAHAKGYDDAHSDLDLYVFADDLHPAAERDARVRRALGVDARPASWGADAPFTQGGTDFVHGGRRVEIWLRRARTVEETIDACTRGEVTRETAVWAVMGFWSHVALADVHAMRIVHDPRGTLARWKERVRVYPGPLRDTLLRRALAEAAFWPRNPHYESAVARGDLIYTAGIVQQVVHALIQAVFALNRAYFPGEKKLARAMEALPVQPADFAARVQALLYPGRNPDVSALSRQRAALAALVDEMRELASFA